MDELEPCQNNMHDWSLCTRAVILGQSTCRRCGAVAKSEHFTRPAPASAEEEARRLIERWNIGRPLAEELVRENIIEPCDLERSVPIIAAALAAREGRVLELEGVLSEVRLYLGHTGVPKRAIGMLQRIDAALRAREGK